MHNAVAHRRKSLWPESQAEGSVTLTFEARHSSRVILTTGRGERVLLDLPHPAVMRDGDGLRLGDGRWIAVKAAPEPLIEVHHRDPHHLVRLAWHLGNRQVPAEIGYKAFRIQPDPAIEEMLVRAGAQLTNIEAPFHPEAGLHGGRGTHGHHGESR